MRAGSGAMSFFKKLKKRLFKSSSKIDEGLEAIVQDADGQENAEAARAARQGDEVSTTAPATEPQPQGEANPSAESNETSGEPLEKPGLIGRVLGRNRRGGPSRRTLDDAMLESLEELLISSDMGVDTALRVTANMAEGRLGRKIGSDEIKHILADEITRIMEPVARPMPLFAKKPQVVLVVGVNGSGKTTTIGKLASQFRAAGKSVIIAAGDTFRAAAVEQLQVWGERNDVPVVAQHTGADSASVIFDALQAAKARNVDVLIADTAGRLHNKDNLMEELKKVVRVMGTLDDSAPHEVMLVLDAGTGQNALAQASNFQRAVGVTGLSLTKLDGTAKGGVIFAIASKLGLPIRFIGVG